VLPVPLWEKRNFEQNIQYPSKDRKKGNAQYRLFLIKLPVCFWGRVGKPGVDNNKIHCRFIQCAKYLWLE
jgi:hypothetical protein